jgi:hypothetical protein
MKNLDEILHLAAKEKLTFLYPFRLIDTINQYPTRSVIVSSVKAKELFIPSIFFICPETDMDHFLIKIPSPAPQLKYRFLTLEHLSVIEIILRFRKKRDLILHLNPSNKIVQQFLLGCIIGNALSFHFYCLERKMLTSAITSFDDEELAWLKRSYDLSLELSFGARIFAISSQQLSNKFKDNERYYRFNEISTEKILAEYSDKLIEFGKPQYH